MAYIEERLDRETHFSIVGEFCCGADDPLNIFLSDDSFDYNDNAYGTTYLLRDKDSEDILAFYTIKANGVQTYNSKLNEYNAEPVIEIARIAVAFDMQGIGIGKLLFYDYIVPKINIVRKQIAVRAIIVFAEPDNERGLYFYQSLGFKKADDIVQRCIGETFNEECDLYVLSLLD